MKSKKWLFILNPAAGNGYADTLVPTIRQWIKQISLDASIIRTRMPGHAITLAERHIKKGYTHIIAVGGDGTVNEILQTAAGSKNITFGVIPAGSGNDFIPVLGFPERFQEKDWDIFFEEHTALLDIGKCNDWYFINGMGFGIDARIAAEYNKEAETKKGGKLTYWKNVLKQLFIYREIKFRMIADGKTIDGYCFITTVGNGRRFGGGFPLTPLAYADDGMFDICLVNKLSLPLRVKELLSVLKAKHIYDKAVRYFQSDKLLIETDETVPVHLDGEIIYGSRFEVKIIPSRIKMICNPNGNPNLQNITQSSSKH
jgi:diacylglycerol kinase (ATP)